METHSKIGKVTYKKVIPVHVQPRGVDMFPVAREYLDEMLSHFSESGMAGFVMLAWDFKGKYSRGTHHHPDSPISNTLLPSFVAEALRRDLVADTARDVMSGDW